GGRCRLGRDAACARMGDGTSRGGAAGTNERPEEQDQEEREQQHHDGDGERGRGDGELAHSSKNSPWLHGHTQLNPGPRKNDPMIVSVAPNMKSIVKSVMMSFRSPGLVLGLRSM